MNPNRGPGRVSRVRAPVSLLAVLLVLSGCSTVSGSGRVGTETRQVSSFTKIDLAGSGEVSVEQSGSESLTIEADDNVLPNLTSEVSDSTLKLGTKQGVIVKTTNPVRYKVGVKDLIGVSVSGSGSVQGQGMTLQTLSVDISGSGTVNLSGSAVEQNIALSGSGRHNAAELLTEKAHVDISGSGEVTVTVSRELNVEISGSGTVTYSGEPSINTSVSGSGKVTKK
jgi:hypothetical protein